MNMLRIGALVLLPFVATIAQGEGLTTDAAIGGAIGGALGGAVGAELGGREGAIVGAGVGAAAGTAISTQEYREPQPPRNEVYYYDDRYRPHDDRGTFCPPGQAKKGRC